MVGSKGQGDGGSGNESGEVDGEVRVGRKVAAQRSDGGGGSGGVVGMSAWGNT